MKIDEFRKEAYKMVDYICDYYENIENYPVKSQVKPREIFDVLPSKAPMHQEEMKQIMSDFDAQIMKGITHWQSPHFHAYFPANASFPSILAEMLTSAIGAQCMIWDTSPAAAELEEKVLEWLKDIMDLPSNWSGVIQDTASTATLCALLTAREKYSNFEINEKGFNHQEFRIYCSSETHSSIEKAVKIMGVGKKNVVKIPTNQWYAIDTELLEKEIQKDIENKKNPLSIIATLGTTGTTSIDDIDTLGKIAKKYGTWLHIDAAFGGSAMILPEFRKKIIGLELADSFVFNPHKWLFTNFDCSAYYVKDKESLIKTFSILPEYLKTNNRGLVNDYRDWGVPLGRRFRALKLWFVLRYFGIEKLRNKIRTHLQLAEIFKNLVIENQDFELLAPLTLNTICFRFKPVFLEDEDELNSLNEKVLNAINNKGKLYLSHTKIKGKYTLRMVIGQTNVEERHVLKAWEIIREECQEFFKY